MTKKQVAGQLRGDKRRLLFGRCLRAVRIADGMTQHGVASLLGVTRSSLALYETGRHWPSAPILLTSGYARRATALYHRAVGELPVGGALTPADCDRILALLAASSPVPS